MPATRWMKAVILAAGCSGPAALTGPMPVRDVEITVDVPGRCIFGGCDPVSLDRATLALVRVVNRGADTSYVAMCGSVPNLAEQQLTHGQWQFTGPAAVCANAPPTMALAPGDSVLGNWYPPRGVSRITLAVGGTAAPRDMALDASRAVRLP